MGFVVLQYPDIAFSGGAIDPARWLEYLLLLLKLCGASNDEHSNPKTPGHAEGWLADISPQTTRPDGVCSVE